ncbi:MAG: CAP domain-containing protein [Sporichthyaceae bacterium]
MNLALRRACAGLAIALTGTLALQLPADAAMSLSSARTNVDSLTDAARKKAGCKPLTISSRLNTSAQRHAKDMAANRFLSHTSSNGTTWMNRIKAAGYPSPGAENVARGYDSATVVVREWLKSPSHKRNIVNCAFTKVGIGYANPGNYWVQDFGY